MSHPYINHKLDQAHEYVSKLPGYPCDKCSSNRRDNPKQCTAACPIWFTWFRRTWHDLQENLKPKFNKTQGD